LGGDACARAIEKRNPANGRIEKFHTIKCAVFKRSAFEVRDFKARTSKIDAPESDGMEVAVAKDGISKRHIFQNKSRGIVVEAAPLEMAHSSCVVRKQMVERSLNVPLNLDIREYVHLLLLLKPRP